MTTRERITELTKSCHTQIDFDKLVSANGGLGNLKTTHFANVANDEFSYEWEIAKMARGRKMTKYDID